MSALNNTMLDKYCLEWNNQTLFPSNDNQQFANNTDIQCHFNIGLFMNEVCFFTVQYYQLRVSLKPTSLNFSIFG